MIEHIGNCHGEWNNLLLFLTSLPFIGAWWRMRKAKKCCGEQHDDTQKHA